MAQVILAESALIGSVDTLGSAGSSLSKDAFISQVAEIEVEEDDMMDIGEPTEVQKCDETLSRALQMQTDIQNSIDSLRQRESERLQVLSTSLRELEQSQTVTLLILGMLNRRVLYDYPSLLAGEDSDDEHVVETPGCFTDEIALVRKTLSDLALAERRLSERMSCGIAAVQSIQSDVEEMKSMFEDAVTLWNQDNDVKNDRPGLPGPSIRGIIEQTEDVFVVSENQSAKWRMIERAQMDRLVELSDPVWDVSADIRNMVAVLESGQFDLTKDEFLRKMLVFANDIPRCWPQALNFRNEVRSDVRCNLGLDKYSKLRWHQE